jgi:hypothetical protein
MQSISSGKRSPALRFSGDVVTAGAAPTNMRSMDRPSLRGAPRCSDRECESECICFRNITLCVWCGSVSTKTTSRTHISHAISHRAHATRAEHVYAMARMRRATITSGTSHGQAHALSAAASSLMRDHAHDIAAVWMTTRQQWRGA